MRHVISVGRPDEGGPGWVSRCSCGWESDYCFDHFGAEREHAAHVRTVTSRESA